MSNLVFHGASFPLPANLLGGNARGYIYVCATCGDSWGRVEISERGNYIISPWPCEAHGTPFNRGGSFLHRVSWADFSSEKNLRKTLEALSPELLLHEVMMRIFQILRTP